jgi:hypothetical protein
VYALGATALALLTGREPEDLPHRGLAIDVARALPHDPAFARVLTRMLEPDPDRRATEVAPLVAELAPPRGASTPHGANPSWTPGSSRSSSSSRNSRDSRNSRGSHGHRPHAKPLVPSSILMLVLVVGLVIARFSTGALFRIFLPILLTLLSIFFGGGLRRAAAHMRHIGEQGDEGIRRALDVVRGRRERRSQHPNEGRQRMRVEDEDDAAEELDEDVHQRWKRRERR